MTSDDYCEECGEELEEDEEEYCKQCSAVLFEDEFDFDSDPIDGVDPGGTSALRAATPDNPRNLPCPTCGKPNRLTPIDVQRGYQCDSCSDILESITPWF